ncbi:cytochrome c oxidase assembly protein [Halomonas beimenensis]|uniref:Cytochrome c oxidase assembly protein CtaG n=1 Tax=Halomonas beimenensis TaxID=475662 RepID=A0A291P7U7_9GAMM|nr:cytochrome c oxidase assembly protein [Halomonas beimenensis]ATJ82921.1 cytochrome oxidase biogenesis protein Cox11-CtaG, copper delivery to Cox1 [Halomonas beimenensis]
MQTGIEREDRRRGVRRTVGRTLVVLAGMFVFAFALVPLYDVFCQVTGLNGKTSGRAQALVHEGVDTSRTVTVQFITRGSAGLPWRLEADNRQLRVHPGESREVTFRFRNQGETASRARAVPSVSPSEASLHLRKLACFCFQEQRLAAGEELAAPLVFQLTPDLPAGVTTVTLVYTLYPVEPGAETQTVRPQGTNSEGDRA